MKQKQVIMIIIVAVIVVAIVAIAISLSSKGSTTKEEYVEVLEDGTKINTSEKLSQTKTYNGIEFSNIKFTNASSVTNLSADVKNTTSEDMGSQVVGINVLDEQGNVITTFKGSVESLKAGETTTFNAAIAANYANAYDIEIVAVQ